MRRECDGVRYNPFKRSFEGTPQPMPSPSIRSAAGAKYLTEPELAHALEVANRLPWRPSTKQSKREPKTKRSSDFHATLDECAEALGGLSRERVRQIEAIALAKARAWCEAQGWRLEDLLGLGEQGATGFG